MNTTVHPAESINPQAAVSELRALSPLGAEFFASMQEYASKRGMSCTVAPRAVTVTDEQEEAYELSLRQSLMADAWNGRLSADAWLTPAEQEFLKESQ